MLSGSLFTMMMLAIEFNNKDEVSSSVGTLDGGYVHNAPLPQVPQVQNASLTTDGVKC